MRYHNEIIMSEITRTCQRCTCTWYVAAFPLKITIDNTLLPSTQYQLSIQIAARTWKFTTIELYKCRKRFEIRGKSMVARNLQIEFSNRLMWNIPCPIFHYLKKISSYSHVLNFLISFMLVLVHNVHPIKYSFLQISQPRGLLQKSWQTKKVWKGFARNQITKLWLKLYLFNTPWEF